MVFAQGRRLLLKIYCNPHTAGYVQHLKFSFNFCFLFIKNIHRDNGGYSDYKYNKYDNVRYNTQYPPRDRFGGPEYDDENGSGRKTHHQLDDKNNTKNNY